MQYNQDHIQFIQKLKLLPKHAMPTPEDEGKVSLKEMKKLFTLFADSATLNRTLSLFNDLAQISKDIANTFDILEDRAKLFNEQLGISSTTSIKYALALDKVAISLNRHAAGYKRAFAESAKYYKGTAQYQEKYSKGTNKIIASMREELKLSEDQAQNFRRNALATGVGTDALYKQVLMLGTAAQNAELYDGASQDLIETFAKISPLTLSRYYTLFGDKEEGTKQIALAALKINQMGMDFDQIEKSSRGFLDIQKKSSQQMFLQEVTGKQILTHNGENYTQAMQQAYINNDINKQFELQRDLILDHADELRGNVFMQEKYAEFMDYSQEQIANVLAHQGNLNELQVDGLQTAEAQQKVQEELEKLQKKEIDNHKLSIDDLIKMNDLRTQQEKIDADISVRRAKIIKKEIEDNKKIQGAPGQDIEQIREKVLTGGVDVAAKGAKAISGVMGAVTAITTTISTGDAFLTALKDAADALSAVETESAPASGGTEKIDDGIIQFNPRDKFTKVQVVAGTHEGGNKALAKQLAKGGGGGGDVSAIVSALNSMSVIVRNQFNGKDLMTAIKFAKAGSSNVGY